MDFIIELIKSFGTYIGLVLCAAVGVFCGIKLRKRKNEKKALAEEAKGKAE